jgi:hypothetical protein
MRERKLEPTLDVHPRSPSLAPHVMGLSRISRSKPFNAGNAAMLHLRRNAALSPEARALESSRCARGARGGCPVYQKVRRGPVILGH